MAAPRTSSGLAASDLVSIREALAGGRKPRVVFTAAAGQIAGQAGQVVELTDPAATEEWIVVRFGRDELPFSPDDLALPVRGAAKAVPARAANGRRTEPVAEPEFRLGTPPAAREESSMPRTGAPTQAAKLAPAAKPAPVSGAAPASAGRAAANGGATRPAGDEAGRPAKAARPKPPASLVVTLTYADKEWTVAATQGSRSLAKPYVIKPTEALRMVALIDVPGVHEAVEAIIAAERAEAEGRALRLRSELAEIESRLAELTNHA